jgi:hypothetical protein
MENQEQQGEMPDDLENFFNISFDLVGLDQLKQISVWARICSITGMLGYLIQLYGWLFGHWRMFAGLGGGLMEVLLNLVVIGGGGVVNWFLYRFAAAVTRGVQNSDALYVNSGFNSLRLYFKTAGILVIVAMGVVILAIISFILSASQVMHIQ